MPKYRSKLTPPLKKDFPFIKLVNSNDPSQVFCTLCDSKINIASKGRGDITSHIASRKHINRSQMKLNSPKPAKTINQIEKLDDKSFTTEIYTDKCRCCLRKFQNNEFVDISEETEKRFFELTQIQLISCDELSKRICSFCENDLEVFSNFRVELIEKQKKLYRYLKSFSQDESEQEINYEDLPKVSIKTEVEESSPITIVSISTIQNFVDIKEVDDEQPAVTWESYNNGEKEKEVIDNVTDDHQRLLIEVKQQLKKEKELYVSCPLCCKTIQRYSLIEHISVIHFNQIKLKCDYCNYKARRRLNLLSHLKRVHSCAIDLESGRKIPKKHHCIYCGLMTENRKRHMLRAHKNIKNVFCDLCLYSTYFKPDLENHMQVHINQALSKVQKFICDVCGLHFKKRSQINSHMKSQHMPKERNYQCPICYKCFSNSDTLKKHNDVHVSKNLPCEVCGKIFSGMNTLRSHLYTHSKPKYVCEYPGCDKAFYKPNRFRTHIKTHEGKRDYKCSLCDKGYYYEKDLSRHIDTIHSKLRFYCHVLGCSGDFSRKAYYKKHAKAQHQNLHPQAYNELMKTIDEAKPQLCPLKEIFN